MDGVPEHSGRLQNQFSRSAEHHRDDLDLGVRVQAAGTRLQRGARRKRCPAGAEPCIGSDLGGEGHWKHDTRGAIVFAVSKFLERDAKVTRYNWGHQDLIEGHHLQLTNRDGSRTFAFVGMHEMKLYIVDGTVPAGAPEPGLFQQSMGWVDANGNGIRYQMIYSNEIHGLKEAPMPARAGGGRGRGAGPQGQGGGAP